MNATKSQSLALHIRWMIRRDMEQVLAIEKQCFQFPWGEEDFIRCLRQVNCIGMVVDRFQPGEERSEVLGFMIYELHKHKLHVLDFAVHEDCRYRGVGTAMARRLVTKLSHDRRSRVVLEVRETNLDAQCFFKRLGFKCVGVLRDHYEDAPDDAYQFVYRYRECEGKQ